jgi:hypothetical protein
MVNSSSGGERDAVCSESVKENRARGVVRNSFNSKEPSGARRKATVERCTVSREVAVAVSRAGVVARTVKRWGAVGGGTARGVASAKAGGRRSG